MRIESKTNYSAPFLLFKDWFDQANQNQQIIEPTAMCLATVGVDNKPSSRMVLLKKFDERGFCFFTNLNSRKSHELNNNHFVALCFYWGALRKQVRIEGYVEKVSDIEADEYFSSRRPASRIGAWASRQSQKMNNWQEFMDRIDAIKQKFHNQDIPRPNFWSGFRVIPNSIEFWQEGDFRIHERHLYKKIQDGWIVDQLYP